MDGQADEGRDQDKTIEALELMRLQQADLPLPIHAIPIATSGVVARRPVFVIRVSFVVPHPGVLKVNIVRVVTPQPAVSLSPS
jgi:hypothetical protein